MNLAQLAQAHELGIKYETTLATINALKKGADSGVRGITFACRSEDARTKELRIGGDTYADAMDDAVRACIENLEGVRDDIRHQLAVMGIDADSDGEQATPPPAVEARHKTGDMWTRRG